MIDDNPGLIDSKHLVSFSEIFGYLRKYSQSLESFENVRNVCLTSDKFWQILENLQKVFGNLRKIVVISMLLQYARS